MNYMIVDDEHLVLRDTTRMLEKILDNDAQQIYSYDNCSSALALVREKDVHVAFLDVDMPEMTGIELAQKIHELSPRTNIIFLTAYAQYSLEAWRVFASGFLVKPALPEDIEMALKHLRYPAEYDENKIRVHCFGNFDIFYREKRVDFSRTKSKEMFAYLIDRKGAAVSSDAVRAILWEASTDTEAKKTYIRSIASDIRQTFEKIGFTDVLVHGRGTYAVNTKLVQCDYYDLLKGEPKAMHAFKGEYMTQYSWAEQTLAELVPLL